MTGNVAETPAEAKDNAQLEREVKINDLLRARISTDASATGYYSRVDDIVDGKLVISWPTHNGMRMPVHRDQLLDLSFVRQDVAHSFPSLVDEIAFEPLAQVTVIQCGPVSTVQRRESFRLKCMVPVEILGAITNGIKDSSDNPDRMNSLKTTTYDLSAGGLAFRHSASIPEDSLVEVRLSLPDHGSVIKIPCRVVYTEQVPRKNRMYHIGICFLAISEAEQARIFRYLFRIQLKMSRS